MSRSCSEKERRCGFVAGVVLGSGVDSGSGPCGVGGGFDSDCACRRCVVEEGADMDIGFLWAKSALGRASMRPMVELEMRRDVADGVFSVRYCCVL